MRAGEQGDHERKVFQKEQQHMQRPCPSTLCDVFGESERGLFRYRGKLRERCILPECTAAKGISPDAP